MNRNTRRTTSTCSRKNNRKKLRQRKLPLPRHENRKHLPNWKKHSQRRDWEGKTRLYPRQKRTRPTLLHHKEQQPPEPSTKRAGLWKRHQRTNRPARWYARWRQPRTTLTHCRRMSVNRNSSKPSLTRTSKRWTARAWGCACLTMWRLASVW